MSLDAQDNSSDSLNIGSGNGKVTLKWDREEKKARVHAWVNGAAGSPNEVRWTVYAWIPYPGGEHKVTNQISNDNTVIHHVSGVWGSPQCHSIFYPGVSIIIQIVYP